MNGVIKSWPFHNLIAHPLMQIFLWMGMPRLADIIHDGTLPNESSEVNHD